MSTTSLKSNFIYNLLLTISSYIATLVVYPYVSRVLGVENMGVLGFVNKTIECFMLFSLMGISVVGVREIARHKTNNKELNNTFSSLVSFLVLSSFLVSIIYFIIISLIPRFHEDIELFYVGLTRILLSAFYLDWFYQGLENFKYIALRTLCIRVFYIVAVFCFVRNCEDSHLYFYITLLTFVLDALINLCTLRKFVVLKLNFKLVKQYIHSLFTYGIYSVLNATFSTFNYILLGFLCSNVEVGYYSTSDSIYRIFLSIITAFSTVMLPRMSSLIKNNDVVQFNKSIEQSLKGVLSICIPVAIFGVTFSSEVVSIISGEGYEGAVIPLQIMMVLVLINAVNQVFIMQAAIPMGLDRQITIGTAIAALMSIPLNYFMMKNYQSIGCSCVLVFSVILANAYPIYILFSRRYLDYPEKIFISGLIRSFPYLVISILALIIKNSVNRYQIFIVALILYILCFLVANKKKYSRYLFKSN